jgi:hypothetical protein
MGLVDSPEFAQARSAVFSTFVLRHFKKESDEVSSPIAADWSYSSPRGGTTMMPALIVERQRFPGRRLHRQSAQFASVRGILAATLLSLLVFWLPLYIALSLYRF